MRELATFDDKLRQYLPQDIRLGWFQAPQPFSKKNGELPLESDQSRQRQYPAFFVKPPAGDLWTVRRLAILLNRSKTWYAHWSRVTLITTDDDVMPPLLRLRL